METLGRMGASPVGGADGLDRSGDRALRTIPANDDDYVSKEITSPAELAKSLDIDVDAFVKRVDAYLAGRDM